MNSYMWSEWCYVYWYDQRDVNRCGHGVYVVIYWIVY